MRRKRSWIVDERGSASIEFIGAGMILLLPLLYLVITLAQIQSQSFGVESAARFVARHLAQHPGDVGSAEETAAIIAEQYGIDPDALSVSLTCAEAGPCPGPGTLLTITVTASVPLPLIPAFLSDGGLAVPVSASSTQRVSEFVE